MDVEVAKSEKKTDVLNVNKLHSKTSLMLTLYSLMLLVEGMLRVVRLAGTPKDAWDGNHNTFPPIVQFVGAVGEVFFSLLGLFVGLGEGIFGIGHPMVTAFLGFCELTLGWFVFIVYIYAEPGFNESRNGPFLGLSDSKSAALRVFGEVFPGTTLCFITQGTQFYFTFALYKIQTGADLERYKPQHFKPRVALYSFFVFLGGMSTLIFGSILRNEFGSEEYMAPIVYPPNVVKYATLTIISGLVLVIYAMFLVVATFIPSLTKTAYLYASLVYMWFVGGHILGQISLIAGPMGNPAADAAPQIVVLITAVILSPAYMMYSANNYDMMEE